MKLTGSFHTSKYINLLHRQNKCKNTASELRKCLIEPKAILFGTELSYNSKKVSLNALANKIAEISYLSYKDQ